MGTPASSSRGPTQQRSDDDFLAEVRRIISFPLPQNVPWAQVLGLVGDLSPGAAKKRYKGVILLLLHPDKRRESAVELAGGKEVCDRAFERVQEAYDRSQGHVATRTGRAVYPPQPGYGYTGAWGNPGQTSTPWHGGGPGPSAAPPPPGAAAGAQQASARPRTPPPPPPPRPPPPGYEWSRAANPPAPPPPGRSSRDTVDVD